MEYKINNEEVEIYVEKEDYLEAGQDGDWEVRLYFEEYVAITYVTAETGQRAIELMTDKLSHLLSVDQPDEVVVELKGGYAL